MYFLTHRFERIFFEDRDFRFREGFLGTIERDLKARCAWYYGTISARLVLRSLFREGAGATLAVRIGEVLRRRLPLRWLGHLVMASLRRSCHIVIGRGAAFGPGLVLLHPHGVFIHKTVRAGVNLVLQNDLTLGGEDDQGPQIGDNVFIGVGARVIGPVKLGSRCRIGANAVVMVSVREDYVAAGNPARQIPIAPDASRADA